MSRGAKIRNVGPKSAAWLRQVGVRSLQDLREAGPVAVYLKVKRAGFRPSLNLLYAMEGALLDCHWQDVPDARRSELVLAVDAIESEQQRVAALSIGAVTEVRAGDPQADALDYDFVEPGPEPQTGEVPDGAVADDPERD
ncbi:MAG TPA: TfoX/Sxy family protein [Xanthomonadaceae bacterium]|nr:TfoX/Sxy family protein [Xanthomonadaceae bacterium]